MTVLNSLLANTVAQHQTGDVAGAAQGYATILQTDPHNPDAWHLSGVVALQSGRLDDAVDHMEHAIAIRNDNPEYFCNLAIAYTQQGALPAAEQTIAKALKLAPQLPIAHFRRGKVLVALGRVEEALDHFQRALELNFDPASILLEASVAYRTVGNIRQSTEALESSAALAADPIAALCQLAALHSEGFYELNELQFQLLIEAVSQATDDPTVRKRGARAAFALATILEHAGRYQEAFELYLTGNSLVRSHLGSQISGAWLSHRRTYAERLRSRITAKEIQDVAPYAHSSQRPIFVVGFPRSGTSLVSQILAAHSQVGSAGELKTMSRLVNRATNLWDDRPGPIIDARQMDFIATNYLDSLAAFDSKSSYVVDKMPGNGMILGFIHMIFPKATLIWCRRDPRDVAISCHNIMFEDDRLQYESSRLEWLVQLLRLNHSMREYWHEVMPGKIYEVDYESLTDDPENQIRQLLQACSLPWEDACLSPEKHDAAVRTASSLQVRQPIHQRSQRRWQRFRPWLGSALEELDALTGEGAGSGI